MLNTYLAEHTVKNPVTRARLLDLWQNYLEWLPGREAQRARRVDFVAALREAGYPVGMGTDHCLWVGGLSLDDRRWVVDDGWLVLAVA